MADPDLADDAALERLLARLWPGVKFVLVRLVRAALLCWLVLKLADMLLALAAQRSVLVLVVAVFPVINMTKWASVSGLDAAIWQVPR